MDKVAVVVTVLNEEKTIEHLVKALRMQTTKPCEVVVVDGGSTDSTFSRLKKHEPGWKNLHVYQLSGNRSVCRNFGVTKTKSSIVAFTDAGCIPHKDWLEELIKPFVTDSVNIVSGYYEGMGVTPFQKSLIPYVLVMPDKAVAFEFFPSTRSMAIRRSAWQSSGGFDPKLSHNEDYAFAHHLKFLGHNFFFAPKAIVSWLPPNKLSTAAKMFFRFAYGDIEAGIIRPKVKMLTYRYLIGLFLFFFFWELNRQFSLTYILIIFLIYSIWSIFKNFRYTKDLKSLLWLPVLQLTSDLSILFGSLTSFLFKIYIR